MIILGPSVPAINQLSQAQKSDIRIKRIGMIAVLRRASGDRFCWMFFQNWTTREMMGNLIDPLDRLAIVSAGGVTIPPDHNQDRLVTFVQPYNPDAPVESETLRILLTPERVEPAGVIWFWKMKVRK